MATKPNEFNEQLRVICDFLIEQKAKTDYVLGLYYQRADFEFEELSHLEGYTTQAVKVQTRLEAKGYEIDKIKKLLTNFRHQKFKIEVANFLQWILFQTDPPTMVGYKYPSDLRLYLAKIKRYEGDLEMLVEDVNERFKNLI